MSVRRSFLLPFAVLLALVALVAGACSSDDSSDEDAKKTTTTAAESDTDSTDTDSTDTTEPMSDDDFSAAIETAKSALDDAGGDPCKLMDTFQSLGSTMGNPTNTEQR